MGLFSKNKKKQTSDVSQEEIDHLKMVHRNYAALANVLLNFENDPDGSRRQIIKESKYVVAETYEHAQNKAAAKHIILTCCTRVCDTVVSNQLIAERDKTLMVDGLEWLKSKYGYYVDRQTGMIVSR